MDDSSSFLQSSSEIKTPKRYELKTYKRRYLVCIAFAFNSICNAMIWITFAPIQSAAADFFHVSPTAINLFSMTFMICYVPGSILCALMFKKYYLRKSFLCSSFGQLFGSILRFIATLDCIRHNSHNPHISYIMAFIGQTMTALCQPFYTNSPARIPAEWFSKDGRDVATALLSIINPLGIGLGSFIPTLFVTTNGDHWYGFQGIIGLEVILCMIGFILTLLFFYDKPPTSPSMSQKLKVSQLIKTSLRYDLKQILSNKHFCFLFMGFGIGLGLFNALTTLINQYTSCYGYTTDDAGNFGGVLVAGGLIGAVVAGICMEIFHEYRSILKIFTLLACVMLGVLLWQLSPNNLVAVTILFGAFGFMAVPIVAVTFEAAAECTYPINEELSSALLMTSGSLFGISFILMWGAYLPKDGKYDTQLNFSTYFLIISGCFMLLFMMLFGGEYKRWNAEHQFSKYIEDLNDEDISVVESDDMCNDKQIQNTDSK